MRDDNWNSQGHTGMSPVPEHHRSASCSKRWSANCSNRWPPTSIQSFPPGVFPAQLVPRADRATDGNGSQLRAPQCADPPTITTTPTSPIRAMSDKEGIRKEVVSAFKLRTLYFKKRDALDYIVVALLGRDGQYRKTSLEILLNYLSKQNLNSAFLELKTVASAVDICLRGTYFESDNLLQIIDIFDVPCITYSEELRKIVEVPKKSVYLSKTDDLSVALRRRYKLVHQRVARTEGTNFSTFYTIEALLGNAKKVDGVSVLATFHQFEGKKFFVTDTTGTMEVNIANATYADGLFFEGGLYIFTGTYDHYLFLVDHVRLPTVESGKQSREKFGRENWFGGSNPIAACFLTDLRVACHRQMDAKIVVLSDVFLDRNDVLRALHKMVTGFATCPPVAFILIGNFCSRPEYHKSDELIYEGFKKLARIIDLQKAFYTKTDWIIVPGPEDPGLSQVLPRPGMDQDYFELLSGIPNVSFVTNPVRLQYANQEISICRADVIDKMCRNPIHVPDNTEQIASNFCKTICGIGHMCPLPYSLQPIAYSLDHTMYLYPLPDLVILADKFEKFIGEVSECVIANPGSFSRSNFDFYVYYPANRKVEQSYIDVDL
uniref:DNA polymerase II subunit 2 n=1 Tax=Steinernema glaseri TaxID=37863 RepID=A0A1I8ABX7_9BILA